MHHSLVPQVVEPQTSGAASPLVAPSSAEASLPVVVVEPHAMEPISTNVQESQRMTRI